MSTGWKLSFRPSRRGIGMRLNFANPAGIRRAVYKTLRRYKAAFCIYELDGFHSPVLVTANIGYVRLHGPVASIRDAIQLRLSIDGPLSS